jgi:D-amino-acid dehydrogenase
MDGRFDVIVVGAGIVGTSTALHLLMRGKKVLLIDRRGPGEETSYGNAGIIGNCYVMPFGFPGWHETLRVIKDEDTAARIHYKSLPRYLPWIADFYLKSLPQARLKNGKRLWPLLKDAVEEHQTLQQGTEAGKHFFKQGRVALYRHESSFAADELERNLAKELKLNFEILNMQDFSEIEPHLKPIYHKAVRWTDSPRVNNPGAVTKAYAERFIREGGTLLQSSIDRLDGFAGKWRMGTPSGTMEAPDVVLCMGPWSTDLTKSLGYHFPMAYKRGYHQHFRATGDAVLSHAIADIDSGYVLVPMEQGYRITTGVEFAERDAPPTPKQITRALNAARELFPLGDAVEPQPWLGSRPCFTDSLPVIGQAPRHQGLWFNFGHGHVGLTIGPSSGRLLAEIMTGEKPFCDPSPYRANRFAC